MGVFNLEKLIEPYIMVCAFFIKKINFFLKEKKKNQMYFSL